MWIKSSHRHCCHIHMLIVPYWALVPRFSLVPEFRNSWAPWRKEVICLPDLHSPSFLNKWNFGGVSRPKKTTFPSIPCKKTWPMKCKGKCMGGASRNTLLQPVFSKGTLWTEQQKSLEGKIKRLPITWLLWHVKKLTLISLNHCARSFS